MERKLLEGVTVVDLGIGKAPALVARMFADMGASVTRIEPEGGDPFYAIYPAYAVWRSGEAKGVPAELTRLLADADVCILGGEDDPRLERRRDAQQLAAAHPKLVVLDLDDGPAGTAYCGPSTELLAQVRSGLVWEQEPDRPIINAFDPASYGAALQGMAGVLAALIEREGSGQGQVVSTSLFAGSLAWIGTYWARLEKPTPMADYVIPRGVYPLIFRTRDDKFIHMAIGGAGSKYKFYQALEIDDPTVQPSDSGMPKPGASRKDFFGEYDVLAEHVAKKDQAELLSRIWDQGVPAEPVLQPGECWEDPQIVHNGIIETEADGTRRVGLPFKAEPLGRGAEPRAASGRSPLEGFKVVDLGAFVAGPISAVYLADLGADVVKVEAKQGDPNRSIFKSFSVANHGKRVIGIDMKDRDGLEIVQKLAASADVVMNNFRPGVSERLGVDPSHLHSINPSLIAMQAPAFGNTGPLAMKAGFDMVMQAWVGHEMKAAGEGNPPRWNRTNLVDIAGGMIGAVAILAALFRRERTGETVSLESPLCNAGIYTLSELVQRPDGRFEGVQKLNATLTGYHPAEALYQLSDGWAAVVARGDDAALRLRDLLGLQDAVGSDVGAWSDAEHKAIAGKLTGMATADLVALVKDTGVWVEPAIDGSEQRIFSDEKLREIGMVRATQHAQFGTIVEIGTLIRMSRSALGNDLSCPAPGQHTREIMGELGYAEDRVGELYDKQAIV